MFCGDAAGAFKKPPGCFGRKNGSPHLRVWVSWYVEAHLWSAMPWWCCRWDVLHGKGLEALDMDRVLPVAHLDGEVVRAAVYDSVGTSVKWC